MVLDPERGEHVEICCHRPRLGALSTVEQDDRSFVVR